MGQDGLDDLCPYLKQQGHKLEICVIVMSVCQTVIMLLWCIACILSLAQSAAMSERLKQWL